MSDIERLLADLEAQLDVLESALATGRPLELTAAPFVAPAGRHLPASSRPRAEALQQRLLVAQELVAAELDRTRRRLALAESTSDTPRFLDTTF